VAGALVLFGLALNQFGGRWLAWRPLAKQPAK
jgi:hypothetical protein